MEKSDRELKHLSIVRAVALNAVVCFTHLYDYAKQNSGPLKSTIAAVENAGTTVLSPVYQRLKGVPDDFLVFLDQKVDKLSSQFDEHAPPVVKKIASKAQYVVEKGSEVVISLAQEVIVSGPRTAISHATSLSKNFAVSKLALLWYVVNRFPPLHGLGDMTIPTIAYWSESYNKFISKMDARGYHIFGYLPSVPVDDIAKAYKQVEAAAAKKDDGASE